MHASERIARVSGDVEKQAREPLVLARATGPHPSIGVSNDPNQHDYL